MEPPEGEGNWELFSEVSQWWWARKLDTGYLKTGLGIWLWREEERIHTRWDNTNEFIDGLPAWSTETGQVSIPVTDFLSEVQSFHDRLMSAMAERVDETRRHWSHPDVRLDWPKLREEHHSRAGRLAEVLAKPPLQTKWDWVRTALTVMERHLAGVTGTE